ncbi:MAG: hypothetical protein KDC28_10805 [Saprospiraceae bacterium]|nr:hypothetical protein [Saprospiraceae bacterium]MCB9317715.1 hypothetical protein [Lewinellaceae bacterium]
MVATATTAWSEEVAEVSMGGKGSHSPTASAWGTKNGAWSMEHGALGMEHGGSRGIRSITPYNPTASAWGT